MRLVFEYILIITLAVLSIQNFRLNMKYDELNNTYKLNSNREQLFSRLLKRNILLEKREKLFRIQLGILQNALQYNGREKYRRQAIALMRKVHLKQQLELIRKSLKNYVMIPHGIDFQGTRK